jgi:hypothetical protein
MAVLSWIAHKPMDASASRAFKHIPVLVCMIAAGKSLISYILMWQYLKPRVVRFDTYFIVKMRETLPFIQNGSPITAKVCYAHTPMNHGIIECFVQYLMCFKNTPSDPFTRFELRFTKLRETWNVVCD